MTFKSTFNEREINELNDAKATLVDILCRFIPTVMNQTGFSSCVLIPVPRAKALNTYTYTQLFFQYGVSMAAQSIAGVTDGKNIIVRHTSTKTTHLSSTVFRVTADGSCEENGGDAPYPGITRNTCRINSGAVWGKDIILVDDIYTCGVNVDEDCIQALYDAGANSVVLFVIANTVQ